MMLGNQTSQFEKVSETMTSIEEVRDYCDVLENLVETLELKEQPEDRDYLMLRNQKRVQNKINSFLKNGDVNQAGIIAKKASSHIKTWLNCK